MNESNESPPLFGAGQRTACLRTVLLLAMGAACVACTSDEDSNSDTHADAGVQTDEQDDGEGSSAGQDSSNDDESVDDADDDTAADADDTAADDTAADDTAADDTTADDADIDTRDDDNADDSPSDEADDSQPDHPDAGRIDGGPSASTEDGAPVGATDDATLDDSSADDSNGTSTLDDTPIDDAPADDATIDDTPTDDSSIDDSTLDDTALDDSTIDDSSIDDTALDDSTIDDSTIDDTALDDSTIDDSSIDDTAVDDVSADDLGLDDAVIDDTVQPETFTLTVSARNALGSVFVNAELCEGSCTVDLGSDEIVTIEARPIRNMSFVQWTSTLGSATGCAAAECAFSISEDTTMEADFTAMYNLAFITGGVYPAELEGIESADARCNQEADAAGLPGDYLAWLSDSTTDAKDRFDAFRGWTRTDGYPVVDTIEELLAGRMLMPIITTADGEPTPASVWTGTTYEGVAGGAREFWIDNTAYDAGSCGDWQGEWEETEGSAAMGSSYDIGTLWTDSRTMPCSQVASVYCLGVNSVEPLSVEPAEGRIAFLSEGLFAPEDGISAADAICQAEGNSVFGGNFLAALATSEETIFDRLALTGEPWVRPDGIPYVEDAADLSDAYALLTGLNVRADGSVVAGYDSVQTFAITGGDSTQPPDPEVTCMDWTVSGGTDVRVLGGGPQSGSANSLGCCSTGCNIQRPVFCFQE